MTEKEYNKRYYQLHKHERKPSILARQKAIGQAVAAYKLSLGCSICGYKKSSKALDFHHLRDKEHSIARMSSSGRSLKSIMKEIEKCIVLCRNCHAELHADECKE